MKPDTIANNTKPSVFLWLCMAIFYLCLTRSAYSDNATNTSIDLIAFFKQAIDSPPDIEKCIVKRTRLRTDALLKKMIRKGTLVASNQYFEGALSGTNFFLRYVEDPGQPTVSNRLDSVIGRSGSSAYQVGGHGVTYGTGENPFKTGVTVSFALTRQMLCMGVGEIEPGTVNWNDNQFTATNVLGKNLHGVLQISNNLPFRLEVSLAGDPQPYMEIQYKYATPADSFAGYPAKFLISYKFNNGLEPLAEIEFKSVLLATQQLSPSFFSETQFADRVTYTNLFSNSDFYAFNVKTKQLVKANPYVKSGGFTNSHSRAVIYLCFILVTLFSLVILLIQSVKQTKYKTKK